MIDFSKIAQRTLEVRLNEKVAIHLTPPKVKLLTKMNEIANSEDMQDIVSLLSEMLSKNTEGKKISKAWIEDNFTIDEIVLMFREYVAWIENIKKSPN